MPTLTSQDYDVHKQKQRTLYAKINVLDFNYTPISEIQGVVLSGSITIDATSDIRRTASISLVVTDSSFNIASGSKIWLDKYINIWTGIKDISDDSIVWTNHGIFMPNNPSIQYSPEEKTLSFEAFDLMAKLTGARNGQIEGIPVSIPANSDIRDTMISILTDFTTFTKYSIDIPLYTATPSEINIDAGGTVYDILTQLRDINSNYQIYFDVNGVFKFEQIPSGLNNSPIVTDDLLDNLVLSYNVSTDFESVKNYIEVYGKSHETSYYTEDVVFSSSTNTYTLTLSDLSATTLSSDTLIGCIVSIESTPNIATIVIKNVDGVQVCSGVLVDDNNLSIDLPASIVGVYLVIKYDGTNFVYYGHQQAYAKIQVSNLKSPFYAGAYYDFGTASIDLTYYNQYNLTDEYGLTSLSDLGTDSIYFYSPEEVLNTQIKIGSLDAKSLVNSDGESVQVKGNCIMVYDSTSDKFIYKGNNKGIGVIRKVCSGGDYDVIYTDSLAYQRAVYELYLATNLNDSITINCVPIYWLDVDNIMSFTLPDEEEATLWMIQNISLDISAEGTMSITAIKFYEDYPPWNYNPSNGSL